MAINIFLDPLEEIAVSILKHHPLETVSAEPTVTSLCLALLRLPPSAPKQDTCFRGLLGWLLRNLTRFSLTLKLLLLVCTLLVHF